MTFVASVAVATDGERRWLAGRVGLTPWRVDRLAQFLCFAATAYLQNILAMTVASSLFLSHVGAESLPLCFILLGLVAAIGFTILGQWVDRFSRVRLFQYVLAGAIVWMLGLRLLLGFDWLPLYFILSISAFFLFDLHANLLFPNLLTDYFTTLEYKRNTPFLGLAQAFGILLAGGLTPLLLTWLSTPDLLFILVGLYGLSIAQLAYLEAMQRRLEAPPPKTRFSSWQYLQTLPTLIKGSPLIFFLAASS
ncbi:MAG: cyclic nucleotide-binding domain-containing protein, partial [Prochlorothrix sp.]